MRVWLLFFQNYMVTLSLLHFMMILSLFHFMMTFSNQIPIHFDLIFQHAYSNQKRLYAKLNLHEAKRHALHKNIFDLRGHVGISNQNECECDL